MIKKIANYFHRREVFNLAEKLLIQMMNNQENLREYSDAPNRARCIANWMITYKYSKWYDIDDKETVLF